MTKAAVPTIYVQYGCGLSCPDGWINFDVSPRLRLERLPIVGTVMRARGIELFPGDVRYGDIVRGLPIADASVDGVYCSHVLEHIDRVSVETALANTFRILKPGGTFRLVVPDLIWRARELVVANQANSPTAADNFMRSSYLGQERPVTGLEGWLRAMFGNSGHRWMYDFSLMAHLLAEAGFENIRRCNYGDAVDRMFDLVEEEGRFVDRGHAELAIEAQRPPA